MKTAFVSGLRTLTCILGLTLFASSGFAQVAVTNPGNTTPGLQATYTSLALAIADLNAQTAIAGPVTVTLTGNETAPAGGYAITAILAGASSTNSVTIEGSSSTITGSTALTAGALNDAIFKIVGSDFVTLQNFTMQEDPANLTTAAGTNNMTEWGVALLYASTTDGAQNCTIQNNTISLNRIYQNTFGIYSNSTHSATAVTVSATATTAAGGNSGLKVYGNNVSNVNQGIVVVGPTAAVDHNTLVDIGGAAPATGNTLTNYGTTTTGVSGYANVSATINGILVRNSNGYNISYNNITSSSGASGVVAGTVRGIFVPAASNQPTGTHTSNVNNNTLAVTSHVLAGTINGISVESTTSTPTSTTNINNNNFTTLNHTIAAATGTITAILQSGSAAAGPLVSSVSNNTFTNLTSSSTGSFTFISNSWSASATSTKNVNNNSIVTAFNKTGAGGTVLFFFDNALDAAGCINNSNGNTVSNVTLAGAATFTGIQNTNGGSPTKSVLNNVVSNVVGGTGTTIGIATGFDGGPTTVSGNTVANLTGGGAVTGMSHASGVGVRSVTKNKIHDLTGTGAASLVSGVLISSGTNSTHANNLIGNLFAPSASGNDQVRGISITSILATSTVNVYYNTVLIAASSSGANFGTTGIFHTASATATTAALNLRNNIIVNTSTAAGTGLTVAYRRSSGAAGTLANYAGTSNNNDFYAGTPSATNLIYADGTSSAQTIAAYKGGVFTAGTIAPRDSASFSENTTFLSTTGASADFLHVDPSVATQTESGGAPIAGITDDYDGNSRNVSTPDTGADEFNGILLDLSPPSITYTALGHTASTATRTLTATITDASGVPTAGAGLPVLYWKVNAGAYTAATASFLGGTQYEFSFGSPVSLGDVVSYYIVAQDNAVTPNVGSSPAAGAGGFTANPPAAGTPPTTPNSYNVAEITGTKTVGGGGDYADLASAINALNGSVITRPVVFNLTDAAYGVPAGGLTINANPGSSATNTVTIKPASGNTVAITGAAGDLSVIKINGFDYLTIDGSNNGTASQDMTITSGNTAGLVVWIASGADGANGNTVKNAKLVGTTTASAATIGGVLAGSGGVLGNEAEFPNSNNTLQNLTVTKVQNAAYLRGGAVNFDQNWLIADNTFGSTVVADKLFFRGMLIGNAQNFIIRDNTINGVTNFTGSTATMSGIQVAFAVNGGSITGNKISDMKHSNTGGWGSNGIFLAQSSNTANVTVANNFIWDIASQGFNGVAQSDNGYGIMITTGAGYNIYFNSVNLNTNQGANAATGITAAINIASTVTAVGALNIRDNVLSSTQTLGTRYAIYNASTAGATVFSAINNNDYFAQNVGFQTVAQATLANWQTATGQDGASLAVDPLFVSATDLHLQSSSPMLAMGVTIAGQTVDIDGELRELPPDIGGDEIPFVAPPCPGNVDGDGFVDINDLLEVINNWGPCPGSCPPSCAPDISGLTGPDCQVNIDDLLEVINNWGACP